MSLPLPNSAQRTNSAKRTQLSTALLLVFSQQVLAQSKQMQPEPNTGDIVQHYVNNASGNALDAAEQTSKQRFDRRYCSGTWVAPNANATKTSGTTKTSSPVARSVADTATGSAGISAYTVGNGAPIVAFADSAYVKPHDFGTLSGHVVVSQADRRIVAERIRVDLTSKDVQTQGVTTLQNGDLYTQAENIRFNLDSKTAQVGKSAFFSQSQQAHGSASSIYQSAPKVTKLTDVTYTTCPPQNKSWEVKAKTLSLNGNTGRAVAQDAQLRLLGFPALWLPYVNFPIDDRRMSGFLTPRFGFSNDGGLDLSLPFYLNLAPNYDATLTPRLLLERGVMTESEFRYLTKNYGQSTLTAAYLATDKKYQDKDRYYFKLEHNWQPTRRMSIDAKYNHVSDKDYFSDLGKNPVVQDELNLPRNIVAHYTDDKRELTGEVRVETFQTVDESLPDANKPYSRLPQVTLNYSKGDPKTLSHKATIDAGYFAKRIKDDTAAEESGFRMYGNYQLDYTFASSWGYLKPAISVSGIANVFDNNAVDSQGLVRGENDAASVVIPSASLDSGLVFEKQGLGSNQNITQTIEPRAYLKLAARKAQNPLPNFDTTTASASFDQLFGGERFLGYDRIDDNSSLSLGMGYRLYESDGLERLGIDLATKYNLSTRQTNLSGRLVDTDRVDGYFGRVKGYVLPSLNVSVDTAVDQAGAHNYTTVQLGWQPKPDTLVNLGYFNRSGIASHNQPTSQPTNEPSNQLAYQTASASLIAPINSQWRVVAHSQYDVKINKFRDMLLGANYESCCYGLALYARSYYNNLEDPTTEKPHRQLMGEITLKGLAGISGRLENLLNQRILGYTQPASNQPKQ